jgi:dihydroorotase
VSERPVVVKGGRIFDPSQKLDRVGDLVIRNGKVAGIENMASVSSDFEVIDAKGLLVTPGWVDIHCHFREPGQGHKETIKTGSQAAAAGGFTSVACMANTNPVNDSPFVTSYLMQKIAAESDINIYVIGAVTKGLQGEELAPIGSMFEAGVVAVSDDGKTVMNSYLMRKAMDYAKRFDLTVIVHCEDSHLKGQGVMNEGFHSAKYGLRGIPKASEEIMVARDISLAELTGCKLHVAHVSTKGSVELIRQAKARGVRVTAEVTPHHLTLTDEAVGNYDTNTKVAPPLRETEDIAALRSALADGTIDALATDHAPHAVEEKEVEYDLAEFGMVGLETAFPLYYQTVLDGSVSLSRLVEALTTSPARIIGVPKGTLAAGVDADVTLADLGHRFTVDRYTFHSKSQNSPFHGRNVQGAAAYTLVRGKVVHRAQHLREKK